MTEAKGGYSWNGRSPNTIRRAAVKG